MSIADKNECKQIFCLDFGRMFFIDFWVKDCLFENFNIGLIFFSMIKILFYSGWLFWKSNRSLSSSKTDDTYIDLPDFFQNINDFTDDNIDKSDFSVIENLLSKMEVLSKLKNGI